MASERYSRREPGENVDYSTYLAVCKTLRSILMLTLLIGKLKPGHCRCCTQLREAPQDRDDIAHAAPGESSWKEQSDCISARSSRRKFQRPSYTERATIDHKNVFDGYPTISEGGRGSIGR